MLRVCFAALLLAGCAPAPVGVDLTIDANALGDTRSLARNIHFDVTAAVSSGYDRDLPDGGMQPLERIIYAPGHDDRRIGIQLYVHDRDNVVLGCGSAWVDWVQDRAVPLTITLLAGDRVAECSLPP